MQQGKARFCTPGCRRWKQKVQPPKIFGCLFSQYTFGCAAVNKSTNRHRQSTTSTKADVCFPVSHWTCVNQLFDMPPPAQNFAILSNCARIASEIQTLGLTSDFLPLVEDQALQRERRRLRFNCQSVYGCIPSLTCLVAFSMTSDYLLETAIRKFGFQLL